MSADRPHFRCLLSLLSPPPLSPAPYHFLPNFPVLHPPSPMAIIIVLSVLPPSQIAQQQLHCGKDNRENIDTDRKMVATIKYD